MHSSRFCPQPASGDVSFTASLWSHSHRTLWIRPVCMTSLKLSVQKGQIASRCIRWFNLSLVPDAGLSGPGCLWSWCPISYIQPSLVPQSVSREFALAQICSLLSTGPVRTCSVLRPAEKSLQGGERERWWSRERQKEIKSERSCWWCCLIIAVMNSMILSLNAVVIQQLFK